MRCKKCKSPNVSLRMIRGPQSTGYQRKKGLGAFLISLFSLGLIRPKVKVQSVAFKKIAFCKNCGYSWTVHAKHGK